MKADKGAELDRKIVFFGIIEAFGRGSMPDNKRNETVPYVRDSFRRRKFIPKEFILQCFESLSCWEIFLRHMGLINSAKHH